MPGRAAARPVLVAAAALAVALACWIAACNSSGAPATPASTTQAMTRLLGHAPTGAAATVAKTGVLTVAVDAAYPPQSSIDPSSKELVGFNIDVADRIGALLQAKVRFVTPVWDKIPLALRKGEANVAVDSLPITASSSAGVAFTTPYVYQNAAVAVLSGGAPLTSAADLQGTTVGVVAQSVYQLWLQNLGTVTVRPFASESDAADALRAGSIGGLMTAQADGWQLIDGGAPFELRGPFFYQPLGLATARGQLDLIAVLNAALARLRADGTLAGLSEKWYGGHDITKRSAGVPRYQP
ncbi:MAG TPA: transporter substrate-binding domain-containing protein [Thermoleophilia bacterium]|nr:transporter substrate-binding domain-containing protein [Thermoleophilia bacterium]